MFKGARSESTLDRLPGASEYTEGTLVVDIYEAKTKQLMWRGVAQGELKDSPEKREKQLQKASDKLFKDFPPGSAKKK
jgi:hypothetical protein